MQTAQPYRWPMARRLKYKNPLDPSEILKRRVLSLFFKMLRGKYMSEVSSFNMRPQDPIKKA